MVCRAVVLALAIYATQAANLRSQSDLATDDGETMQPELVAKALARVQDEWKEQATSFTECTASTGKDCNEAHSSFDKSCATVVSAVVQGSGGDRTVAKEYMAVVCNQNQLAGWRKLRCADLATALVDHSMTADKYANRESFKPAKLCTGFWTKFVDEERKREAQEAKERAEREKREAEEKAKAEAEAKKKAEEEAKAAAERKAKEEAHRIQEEKEQKAKKEADEAKARAAEAAKLLAEKKAEAEAVQKAAQQKLEEANKAEKEHLQRQAEHQKAEESLRNATAAANTTKETSAATPAMKAKAVEKETAKPAEPATKTEVVKPAAPAPKTEVAKPVVEKVEPKVEAKPAATPVVAKAKPAVEPAKAVTK